MRSINGTPVVVSDPRKGTEAKATLEAPDNREVFEVINNKNNYPLNLKFGRPRITTNEKIILASTFYPLYALSVQLSPETQSSGIQELETDTFKLHCSQTVTGIKCIMPCDRSDLASTFGTLQHVALLCRR